MTLPIEHQASEQIGPPEKRRVSRSGAPKHDVISAAGADMAAVEHEFVSAEPALTGLFIENRGGLDRLPPVAGGMDVHFNHARIWRHADHVEARIGRRWIPFDVN